MPFIKANDKYNAHLTAGWIVGQTVMQVSDVPTNVPTQIVVNKGLDNEKVFYVNDKTADTLTGVSLLRGVSENIDMNSTITCLNNEEFINQYSASVSNPLSLSEIMFGIDGGSTDDYAISVGASIDALVEGMIFVFKPNTNNTGASTLNINALGAVAIKKNGNTDVATGDILANKMAIVVFDGTNFQLLSEFPPSSLALPTGGNITVNGANAKRSMYIPASAFFVAVTNPATATFFETTTNKINLKCIDFNKDTEQYAFFGVPMPSYWDLGAITATFYWTAASGSGDVIFGLHGVATSNDDALDTALGTAQEVTDTLITAGDQHITSETAAITIAGTPAAGDWVSFRVYRKAAAAGDTLSADARLLGIKLVFSVNKYSDV